MLLVLLQEFPGVILKAAETYKPNLVARYVLDLARLFNKYYQHVKIVQDDPVLQAARMELVIGVRQVLDTGLGLLGIAAPDAM